MAGSQGRYRRRLPNNAHWGGADYDKEESRQTDYVPAGEDRQVPGSVWRVIWGESVGTSNFSVYVDASTGEFKEKLH